MDRLKKQYIQDHPVLICPTLILRKDLSKHLLGVYISLFYFWKYELENLSEVGLTEDENLQKDIDSLVNLGLLKLDTDGSYILMEVIDYV